MQILDDGSMKWYICNMHFKYVVWSVPVQIQGNLLVQVKRVMYIVQCAGCSVLPAKDENFAVDTGQVKLKFYPKI